MKAYREIIRGYRKRRKENAMDAVLSVLPVLTGAMSGAGMLPAVIRCLFGVMPLAAIVAHEGIRAMRDLKPYKNALQDSVLRLAWTALSIMVGCSAARLAGLRAGATAAMGMRLLLGLCRPLLLIGYRVRSRILRLQELNAQLRRNDPIQKESRESGAYSFTDGEKSAIMKPDSS